MNFMKKRMNTNTQILKQQYYLKLYNKIIQNNFYGKGNADKCCDS